MQVVDLFNLVFPTFSVYNICFISILQLRVFLVVFSFFGLGLTIYIQIVTIYIQIVTINAKKFSFLHRYQIIEFF